MQLAERVSPARALEGHRRDLQMRAASTAAPGRADAADRRGDWAEGDQEQCEQAEQHASAYKRRRRDRGRQHAALAAAQQAPAYAQAPDVADLVTAHAEAAERLDQAVCDPRLRMMMQLHADGWSNAEISQALADGTTPRAVEGKIYRCKRASRGDSDGRR